MQFKKYILQLSLISFALFFASCKEDMDDSPESSFEYIVSYEMIETITVDDVLERFGSSADLVSGIVNLDVDAYKLTYMTRNFNDSMVEASGLVLIPQVTGRAKLTSFQHSTLSKDVKGGNNQENRAPSYLSPDNAEIYLSAVLYASNGYLISAPDYIGYGSTKDLFHPYEHAQTTAETSYDMLLAANELRQFLEVEVTAGTYLIGYSQGGNSTMALHKYMQDNGFTDKFPIAKSAMGAGAYHKSAVGDFIFNSQEPIGFSLSLYLWVMDCYDKVYPSLRNGLSYYLKAEFADEVEKGGYFALSNTNPQEIFTEQFIADINNPESAFSKALADNDIYDWKALAPIKLYHSEKDGLVPYFNSVDAYNAMTAQGSVEISLETFTYGADVPVDEIHGRGGAKFFQEVILGFFR